MWEPFGRDSVWKTHPKWSPEKASVKWSGPRPAATSQHAASLVKLTWFASAVESETKMGKVYVISPPPPASLGNYSLQLSL